VEPVSGANVQCSSPRREAVRAKAPGLKRNSFSAFSLRQAMLFSAASLP